MEIKKAAVLRTTHGSEDCFTVVSWHEDVTDARKALKSLPEGTYHVAAFHYADVEVKHEQRPKTSINVGKQLIHKNRKSEEAEAPTEEASQPEEKKRGYFGRG